MISRRLLMGGGGSGSFAPPVYNGILTVGAISTITNDTYYNAWPVITRIATGSLLCLYTKATSHGSSDQNAIAKISANDGATWGAEISVYAPAGITAAPFGVMVASSGRVIASIARTTVGVADSGEAGVVYSDDNGATWSAWIALTNAFTREAFAAGPAVELPGGNLLVTIEGSNTAQSAINRSSHTVRSTDSGATWGSEVTVRDYASDSRPYYESKLVKLDSGNLLCIHRTSGGTGTHYISTSTDSGATWGAPVAQFAGYGAPSTTQASWGTLVTVTRRNSDAACIAYASIDRGATWLSAVTLDATMYEMEYGCAVQTLDSRWLVVYGYQPTSSITNSDIKQIYVTEGHS